MLRLYDFSGDTKIPIFRILLISFDILYVKPKILSLNGC